VSVDTYLKGKITSRYRHETQGQVKILLSPSLATWAQAVHITTKNWIVRRRLKVLVEHRHTGACGH